MAEIILLICLLAIGIPLLGEYLARVYTGRKTLLCRLLVPVENRLLSLAGVSRGHSMSWREYALSMVVFSGICFVGLGALLLGQHLLPFAPDAMNAMPLHVAFNTTISFITGTNWQSYVPEIEMTMMSQTLGLIVQQFIAPAIHMSTAIVVFRSFRLSQSGRLGNFWVDLLRGILYILLPLSLFFSMLLVALGVAQTFDASVIATTLEGAKQVITLGPIAAQSAIMQIGSNGGGYFAASAAHPLVNPTPLTNLLYLFTILWLPAAFIWAFGVMIGDRRQSMMLLLLMSALAIGLASLAMMQEMDQPAYSFAQAIAIESGNMAGKEQRFGAEPSALWLVLSTLQANGSSNAAFESMMPLTILAALIPMMLGGILFGGIGTSLASLMALMVMVVFMAGLMVGRSPEFLGKKLGRLEIKLAMLMLIIPTFAILAGTALTVMLPAGKMAMTHIGTQGFTEVLYAFTSAAANNGSGLGRLSSGAPYFNWTLGVVMALSNYGITLAGLALAGSLASRPLSRPTELTLQTHTPLFVAMVLIVLLINVLTFAPALALGSVLDFLSH